MKYMSPLLDCLSSPLGNFTMFQSPPSSELNHLKGTEWEL